MSTFSTSLPKNLLDNLSKTAIECGLPQAKIIEKALTLYLAEIEKAAYAASFKRAKGNKDLLLIAEEGMFDYYKCLP